MGSFDKKEKTSSKTSGTATSTPQIPGYIQGPATSYFNAVGGLLGDTTPPTTYGPTQNQTAAFNGASALGGNSAILDAMNGSRGLMNFQPSSVGTSWAPNTIAGPNAADYAPSTMGPAPTVAAQLLADTDLTRYLNPYTTEVVDAALGDIERARAGAITEGQGRATMAGAFGGSRHGVSDSLTNEAALRAAGSTAAGLRAAGFDTARGMALSDIANLLNVDQFNASNALTIGARNQDAENAFRQALAEDRMRAQLANQGAAESATDRTMQGQLANQQADLQGAGVRLNASNQLGAQGIAADSNTRQNLTTQAALGEMERQIAAENDPVQARIARLAQIAQLLGINPSDLIGQTVTQSGTSSGTAKQSGGFSLGWDAQNGLSFGFG